MEQKIKNNKNRIIFMSSLILLALSIAAFIAVTIAWFKNERKITTPAWIETPIVLTIGSGNNHDIKYLDMGDIDVETATYKDYVICVYGTPVDNYSLQLAYTTNIAFHYEVYRADKAMQAEYETDNSNVAASKYIDINGNQKTEYFKKSVNHPNSVISGMTIKEILNNGETVASHQSHHLSYGDENGENELDRGKVQSYAEPLYWLAEEDGTNVLRPLTENIITTADGTEGFLDYYIIHVSWNPDEVKNDKETDIVYITVSH